MTYWLCSLLWQSDGEYSGCYWRLFKIPGSSRRFETKQELVPVIHPNSHHSKNSPTAELWDAFCRNRDGNDYSLLEGLLSIFYFVLITKEKYSGEIPLLCADMWVCEEFGSWLDTWTCCSFREPTATVFFGADCIKSLFWQFFALSTTRSLLNNRRQWLFSSSSLLVQCKAACSR